MHTVKSRILWVMGFFGVSCFSSALCWTDCLGIIVSVVVVDYCTI
jgi:hypothetical protein